MTLPKTTIAKNPNKYYPNASRNRTFGPAGQRVKNNGRVHKFFIASHNVRTLSSDPKIDVYLDVTANIKADVTGICETRKSDDLVAEWQTGDQVFLGRAFDNRTRNGGVGFIVRKKMVKHIKSCDLRSPRIAVLILSLMGRRTIKIIQVYAPAQNNVQTPEEAEEEVEGFYQEVEEAMQIRSTYTVIQGDFNAIVGRKINAAENCIGGFGIGERNERGSRLITFAVSNHLSIMNTCFQKSEKRQWTWRSADGRTLNQIDFVLTDTSRIFTDVSVIGEKIIHTGSDHRLIRSTLLLNIKRENAVLKKDCHPRKNLNADTFSALMETVDLSMNCTDIDEDYEQFVANILKVADLASEPIPPTRIRRIREPTLKLMKARAQRIEDGTATGEEYKKLCKEIRKSLQSDYDEYRKMRLRETAEKRKSIKRTERELQLKRKLPIELKDANGRCTTDRKEMKNICEKFYNEFYASEVKVNGIKPHIEREEIPAVTWDEVEVTIKKMKSNKCPGVDRITAEHLKAGGYLLQKAIAERFTFYLKTCAIPKAWSTSKTVLLKKKGDSEDLGNYRPITLLSQLYKLFTRLLLQRISHQLEFSREQAGFKAGYSTCDHIQALSQLLEKSREYQMPVCLAFVDYRKAFDSVETTAVINALHEAGVNPAYVDIVRLFGKESTTDVQLLSEMCHIKINKGVRQGDTISPKLFAATLDAVFRRMNHQGGIMIDGEKLTHLLYADDCVLFANNPADLQQDLQQLTDLSKEVGLEVNLTKTKWMRNEYSVPGVIRTNEAVIEEVNDYIYLGRRFDSNNLANGEWTRRRRAGWVAFNNNRTVLTDQNLPMNVRAAIFNSTVLPAMLYACETWATTKNDEEKFAVTERAMERRICGVTIRDRISNEKLRQRTGVRDVVDEMYAAKRRWAGHVARQRDNRWTSRLTNWLPRDLKRPLGRPRTRWDEPMVKLFGQRWKQEAQDRIVWRSVDLRSVRQLQRRQVDR